MATSGHCGSSKNVYCEVCGVFVPSVSLLEAHNKGKKHQHLLKHKEDRLQSMKRSVYITGFKSSGSLEQELTSFFGTFGKVLNVFVDKNKGAYAIIEFENEAAVKVLLKKQELPLFNGKHLKVKERTLSSPKQSEIEPKSPVSVRHCKENKKGESTFPSFLTKESIGKLQLMSEVLGQVQLMITELSLKEEEIKLRDLVCQLLQEVFQEVFVGSEVKAFGSSANGLGWKGSDLDICLLMEQTEAIKHVYCPLNDLEQKATSVKSENSVFLEVVSVLRSFAPGCTNIVPVLTAKCPVIRFKHQPSGLLCDLSINNRLGLCNTELLKDFMSLDPRVSQLVWVVRVWAKAKGLSGGGVGQLTSYALTLMVLYYLQSTLPPIIPSLQNINAWPSFETDGHLTSFAQPTASANNAEKSGDVSCAYEHKEEGRDVETNTCFRSGGRRDLHREVKSKVVDGWECGYFKDVADLPPSKNQQTLETLLVNFFDFFGNKFDYGNCVVCIRKGQRTTKEEVNEELNCHSRITAARAGGGKSPVRFGNSKDLHCEDRSESGGPGVTEKNNNASAFKVTSMCIQDPFELTHNVSQNVTISALKRISQQMMDARATVERFLHPKGSQPKNKGILNLFTVPPQTGKKKLADVCSFMVKFCESRCTNAGEKPLPATQSVNTTCPSTSFDQSLSVSSVRSAFDTALGIITDKLGMSCDVTKEETGAQGDTKAANSLGLNTAEVYKPSVNKEISLSVSNAPSDCHSYPLSDSCGGNKSESESTGKRKRDGGEPEIPYESLNPTGKKPKLDVEKPGADKLTAVCTAWTNTWSNRRRERRKRLHSESGGTGTESSQDAADMCKAIAGSSKNLIHSVPVLTVKLTVSAEETSACWVTVELLNNTDRQMFLNFYAFFKKCFQEFVGST